MNFFKLYIGDYQRDTAHLSIAEHGAYLLMLQHYYATEKPLPAGKALHRMLRAQDKAERDAIDAVSSQFWSTTDAGLVNVRADDEISKANAQADTNARIAQEREAKRKAQREQHEQSTNRATNDQPNQTPDTIAIQEEKEPRSTLVLVGTPAAPPPYRRPACPTEEIVALYHEALPALPKAEILGPTRKSHISARWAQVCGDAKYDREKGLEWFGWFFGHVAKSRFLTGQVKGRNGDYFRCTLDFLMTPEKFNRVIENFYHKDTA